MGDGTDNLVAQLEMPRQTSILGQTGILRFPIGAINYGAVVFLIRCSRLANIGALIRSIVTYIPKSPSTSPSRMLKRQALCLRHHHRHHPSAIISSSLLLPPFFPPSRPSGERYMCSASSTHNPLSVSASPPTPCYSGKCLSSRNVGSLGKLVEGLVPRRLRLSPITPVSNLHRLK